MTSPAKQTSSLDDREEFVVGKVPESKELEKLYAPIEEPPKPKEKKPRVPKTKSPKKASKKQPVKGKKKNVVDQAPASPPAPAQKASPAPTEVAGHKETITVS